MGVMFSMNKKGFEIGMVGKAILFLVAVIVGVLIIIVLQQKGETILEKLGSLI